VGARVSVDSLKAPEGESTIAQPLVVSMVATGESEIAAFVAAAALFNLESFFARLFEPSSAPDIKKNIAAAKPPSNKIEATIAPTIRSVLLPEDDLGVALFALTGAAFRDGGASPLGVWLAGGKVEGAGWVGLRILNFEPQ